MQNPAVHLWLLLWWALATLGCVGIGSFSDGVRTVRIAGAGQTLSVSRPDLFDLDISGERHVVRVPAGNRVRRLQVSGVQHKIVVASGATVQSIGLAGSGSIIHLPANVQPVVQGSGVGGRIVHDLGGGDTETD